MAACLSGTANSIREIVKEREIYERERMTGLSSGAYLMSKVLVLGVISVVQALLIVVIGLAGMKMPAKGALIPGPPLIEIAEKYALDPLKILCQDKLISGLCSSNVVHMLSIADHHNAELLMGACIPLVRSQIRQLMQNNTDWAALKESNPRLVNQVLEKVLTYDNAPPPQKKIRLQEVFYRA